MSLPVSTRALQLEVLTALKATGSPLHAPTLVLFTASPPLNVDTKLSDLTLATFTGYAAVTALAFGTPYIDVNGMSVIVAPSEDFISTADTPSETITGWALVDSGLTTLYYAEVLDTPVPITQAGDGLTVDVVVPYGV